MTERIFHGVADMYRAVDGAGPDGLDGLEIEKLIARLARDMQ